MSITTVDIRWSQFQSGCSAVDIDATRYLLTAPHPDALAEAASTAPFIQLPTVLHELCIITSDNPGGFPRPAHLNKERRIELRAEIVSQQIKGHVGRIYPAFGTLDASLLGSVDDGLENIAGVEYGVAIRLDERFRIEHALAIGHEFGQLAIYHIVPAGRRLLACTLLQRNTAAPIQTMHCTKLSLPR
jgi:hypothetical protein